MTENKKKSDWPEKLAHFVGAFWQLFTCVFKELYFSIKNNTAPLHVIGPCSLGLSIVVATRPWFLSWIYLHPNIFWFLAPLIVLSPFFLFGLFRYGQLRQMLEKVTLVFREAGLVTSRDRMPQFLTHHQVDENVFEMRFAQNGILYSQFVNAKEHLRGCFDHIEDIIDHENGHVSIQYSRIPLPANTQIHDLPETAGPFSFAVGRSRAGVVTANLISAPHLLVAGSTNSGKSTFIRQFIATLLTKNKGTNIKFIDLKHSLEARAFKDVKGVTIVGAPKAAISTLEQATKEIEAKAAFLFQNQCSNLEDLFAKPDDKIQWTDVYPNRQSFGRTIIVIDEAAELFLASSRLDPKEAQRANRLATTIAATGRAVGLHLLIATQRPDKVAVDTKIKANLIGRLVFHMADNASSMTALDNVRAAKLPNQPGRAIWREGQEMREVKTLLLKEEDLDKILIEAELKTPAGAEHSEETLGMDISPCEDTKGS